MSGYCPAGKCECKKFVEANTCAALLEYHVAGSWIDNWEVCPWPSRQVPVRPYAEDCAAQEAEKQEGRYCPDTKQNCQFLTPTPEELDEMLGIAKNAGRRAGIEECEKAIMEIECYNCFVGKTTNATDMWMKRCDAISALEKLRDK
jgi:hypothetical protein